MNDQDFNQKLSDHLGVIMKCSIPSKTGTILLSTLMDSRYPYVYPRDCACASRLFRKVVEKDFVQSDDTFQLLQGLAQFIASVQSEDGHWTQRYGLNGQNKAIYIQEDNTAYGAIILANYLMASYHRQETPAELKEYLHKIKNAIQYALNNYYRQEIYLFFSTTSLHESAIEKGYSVWVNHLYILLFNLISQLTAKYHLKGFFADELFFKKGFCHSVHRHFILYERFVRRISPSGVSDLRPDITLMSPTYFQCKTERCASCFLDKNPDITHNTVNFMEESLWDPEMGMLQRYLPFTEDIETHIHAGNGPWIQYTAMLAQHYYKKGDIEKGDAILDQIDHYQSAEGYIPEHLSTKKRFEEFIRLEWEAGLDARKEFHRDILIPNLSYDLIVDELFFMKKTYDKIRKELAEDSKEIIFFAVPLMWSHAEYASALIDRYESLESWKNESVVLF